MRDRIGQPYTPNQTEIPVVSAEKKESINNMEDFIEHCHDVVVSPSSINDCLMLLKETPGSDYAKYEQNRRDALLIPDILSPLRELVHNQKPLANRVISGMIEYYESGGKNRDDLLSLYRKAEAHGTEVAYLNTEESKATICNLSTYDMLAGHEDTEEAKLSFIDLLRRLRDNTTPVTEKPPKTGDKMYDRLMGDIAMLDEEKTTLEDLKKAYDYINEILIDMMNHEQIGIDPNIIISIAWLERRGFKALQAINYETQSGLYRRASFRSMMLFQELITSPGGFDERDFNSFMDVVQNAFFMDVVQNAPNLKFSNKDAVAYSLIADRVLEHADGMAEIYAGEGKQTRQGALWSGNITSQLILMSVFPMPASTKLGERIREERTRSREDQLLGD